MTGVQTCALPISSRFLRYRVDIDRNFKLSKFSKFQFRVKVVYYKAFLLTIGGGK